MKHPLIDLDAIEQCAKKARGLFRDERDPFSLIHDLVHLWPGRSPIENR